MRAMLGEQGTEQFTVTSRVDGKVIGEQRIHDPFIHTKVVVGIDRWDLLKALFSRQYEVRVEVTVRGSEAAQRAIMTLDPEVLTRETVEILEERRISRETSPSMGYYVEGGA